MKTGARFACPLCGYVYDEQKGDPHEGFAPGTPWEQVPSDWACPDCAVREKPDFERCAPAESAAPGKRDVD